MDSQLRPFPESDMPSTQMNGVIEHVREVLRDGARMTDAQLLEDYISHHDEAAIAALVRRHGPMVWSVCRRVLRDQHNAEDAFQATFLVFVRKAASISSRELLANWLYGVAHQTALKARSTLGKRKGRERQVLEMPETIAGEPDQSSDWQAVLDQELSRLPDKYRGVIVLCDLEGRTRREVAGQLGCAEGTVASRLARARIMLADRLTRRGITLSGGALAGVLSAESALADMPVAVVSSTIKAATLLGANPAADVVTARVAALTEGVMKAMFMTKIKSVMTIALVAAALTGTTGWLYRTQAGEPLTATQGQTNQLPKGAGAPLLDPVSRPAKTDRERMVGIWFIMNADSLREGEMWVITEDSVLMHAKDLGVITEHYAHHLDAAKNPKQIDINVTKGTGTAVGVIKGIYSLDDDELRLCLAERGKDRPTAFPEKPKPGEVLILQRETPDGQKPKAKVKPSTKTDEELMAGWWTVADGDNVHRKGELWQIGKHQIITNANVGGFRTLSRFHGLDPAGNPKRIDITVTVIAGVYSADTPMDPKVNRIVGVIKGLYEVDANELRLCLGEMGKDRPAAFPEKPKPGEVLILKRQPPEGGKPKVKESPPAVTDPANPAQRVLTPDEAIKLRSQEKVTVKFKVAAVKDMSRMPTGGFGPNFILLKDGGNFAVRLEPPAMDTIMRLGIEPEKHFKERVIRVNGFVQPDPTGTSFQMKITDLNQFAVVLE